MLVKIHGGWLDSRIPDIVHRLRESDPTLRIDARINPRSHIIERYDLFSDNQWLASWQPHEVDRILLDVEIMRAGAVGRIPKATDRVKASHAKKEAAERATIRENAAAALEALVWAANFEEGRTFFPMKGKS